MSDSQKCDFDMFFTWELMRLGALYSDAQTSFDVIPSKAHHDALLITKTKYDYALELQKVLCRLLFTSNP